MARVLAIVALAVLTMSDAVVASSALRRWRDRPDQFVVEQFHVEPDPWQLEALRAFADPAQQRISLQACVGPGKSAVLSWCGWHFLACQGALGEHPKGAAVSITDANLRDNLWSEFAKWQTRSAYLSGAFTWTSARVFANDHPETWFLAARSWPKTASPDEQGKTLSGLHSQYVLALCDEAGAIPITVLNAAEQILATGPRFGKILIAGNPISLEGMLYSVATQLRDQWTVIIVTGDPADPRAWVHTPRVGPEPKAWATQQIATYGRANPWVKSQILGEFPPTSINALIGIEDVERAMLRDYKPPSYSWAQKRLGIDVARYGDDRTVIFPRQGIVAFPPVTLRHDRGASVSVDIANRVMAARVKWGSELELIDGTGGWGAGTIDVLRSNGLTPIDVQFAAPALDPKFYNRRAEIWFLMAERVKADLAIPRGLREIVAELVTPTYTFKAGKFLLEEKDQVKKRLGRSPDLADALALTWGLVDMPAADQPGGVSRVTTMHATTEYDPFAEDRG